MAAGAFLLAAGSLGVGTAHADNVSQICSSIGDGGVSHGACVSLVQAGNPTALLSEVCADPAAQEASSTANRGQCLKAARAPLP
jgi:hypothetical protein